jgi:hypothetical protein
VRWMSSGADRGSAVPQLHQTAEIIVSKALELSQDVDHRRHQDGAGDPLLLDRLAKGLWVELRNRDLTSTEGRRGKHEWEVRDVKQRRRVQIHTTFSVGQPVIDVVHIRKHCRVRERDAFRTSRRAARVDEREDRFRVVNGRWTLSAANSQRFHVEHPLPWKPQRRGRQ